jgi:hypothetical protein
LKSGRAGRETDKSMQLCVGISKDCHNAMLISETHNKFKFGEWVVMQNELFGEENLGKLKYYMDDRK